MNTSKADQLIDDFNGVLYQFALNIAYVLPDSIIGQHKNMIENKINDPDLRSIFINVFTSKILKYKNKIDAGDHDFFLNKNFKEDLEDNQALLAKIFEFKNIWKELSNENQQMVIQYMQILCQLSQQYFMSVY